MCFLYDELLSSARPKLGVWYDAGDYLPNLIGLFSMDHEK